MKGLLPTGWALGTGGRALAPSTQFRSGKVDCWQARDAVVLEATEPWEDNALKRALVKDGWALVLQSRS